MLRTFLAFGLIAAPLVAHEGDEKVRDRQLPWSGPGYLPASDLNAALAPGGHSLAGLSGQTGLGSVEFESQGVELLSWLPVSWLNPGDTGGNDCWGYVSPSGTEYALMGTHHGTAIVSLADPSAPTLVEFISGAASTWRDIKTYDHYAYAVSEGGGGIQVFDLDQVDQGIVVELPNILTGGNYATHNVAIDTESGYLYRCGGSGNGLRMYSLANPASPTYVGSWNNIYVHDAQIVTYTSGPYAGRQIAFCCGGYNNGHSNTGLYVVDVTSKNSPWVRDSISYSGASYSHQGWLSEDRQLFYLDDELDEGGQAHTRTIVFDVSNLNNLSVETQFESSAKSIGHNLYTRGDYVFEANYRAGLRVFDVSDHMNAEEVAWFDTYPGDDRANFNSLWSCYPHFPSGIVIGSDIEKGLFVWWVGDREVEIDYPGGKPELAGTNGTTFAVELTGDVDAATATLYYDMGAGLQQAALTHISGDTFEATLPPASLYADVQWFIGARSNATGTLWTSPDAAPYSTWWAIGGDQVIDILIDDFETDQGWTVGAPFDDAVEGVWERVNPKGSASSPGKDHSVPGTLCYTTGLDKSLTGTTTLISPVLDLSAYPDAVVEYWWWFNQGGGLLNPVDQLIVSVTDDGTNWEQVEFIKPDGETMGGWARHIFHVADWVDTTDQFQIRFRAKDLQLDNDIEGGIDDVRIRQVTGGAGCQWTNTCVTSPNSAGAGAVMSAGGSASVSLNDLTLTASGAIPGQFGLFFYAGGTANSSFGEGVLCLSGPLQRMDPVSISGAGVGTDNLDVTDPPTQSGWISAGSTWYFQFWYRDPAGGGTGFNTSDSLEVTFCN